MLSVLRVGVRALPIQPATGVGIKRHRLYVGLRPHEAVYSETSLVVPQTMPSQGPTIH